MFSGFLFLLVLPVWSSPVHQANSTITLLRREEELVVERDHGDNPAVAWTLFRVLDSMAQTLEGPGEVFPRSEFHAITGRMFKLDMELVDSQVREIFLPLQAFQHLPGEGLEGGDRLLPSGRGTGGRLGKQS